MKRSLIFAAALGLFAAAQAHDAPAAPAPEVTFIAGESALTGPAYAEAGYVRLILDNRDDAMRAHGIFRIEDGASLQEARVLALRGLGGEVMSPEKEQSLISGFYGGSAFVPLGTQGEVGVTLKPGRYVVYAYEVTEYGPALTTEYVRTLSVTPGDHSAEPPTPDYTVRMADHAFVFPVNIAAGAHLYRVENLGHQKHMMFVSKLLPGITSKDVAASLRGETEEPTVEEEMVGVHEIAPGVFNDVVFDLTPGQYVAFCFVPDPETGTPHAMLGMTQTFTVAAAGAETGK